MKCQYCGYEENSIFFYCPNCGQPAQVPNQNTGYNPNVNPAPNYAQPDYEPSTPNYTQTPYDGYCPTPRILGLIKDNMFLALCILMTITTAFSIISNNIDVLGVLFTIFLWLTYADGRKNQVNPEHIKGVSGTLFASYIIQYIGAALFAVLGIASIALSSVSNLFDAEDLEEIFTYAGINLDQLYSQFSFEDLIAVLMVVMGVVAIVASVLMFVFNILGIRKIHALVKSVYQSGENGVENFAYAKTASAWIIALLVLQVLSLLGSIRGLTFPGLIAHGTGIATLVITNILINKYLCD